MKLYITGGGTGGHVTPGLAIARLFREADPNCEVRFGGTQKGIESRLVPREGYTLDTIEIRGLRRAMNPAAIGYNLHTLQLAAASVGKAKRLLRTFAPDVVIGCGGYASFPIVRAAQKLGIPTVLLEVNAFPGVTTKVLAKKADRVLICFEEARKLLDEGEKIVLTGAPVRGEILAADRTASREKLGLRAEDRYVISFWGSMGAKYMNQHMAGMLSLECEQNTAFRHLHASGASTACGGMNVAETAALRKKLTAHPQTELTEYIYDMATHMAAADLIICRAGAATIGELCALGVPSIMVPSPYVAENHQEKNARALEAAGACRVLLEKDATPEKLLAMTQELLDDPEERERMRQAARKMANLDAAEKIRAQILSVTG